MVQFKTVIDPQIPEEKSIIAIQDLTGIKILVVEDNELNRLLISSLLKKEQIDFEIAENGFEAIQLLGKESFDLILMDIQMPIMDGISATREIRSKLNLSTPIIALSANATIEDTKKYLESGMNDHISKPFKKEELLTKMKISLRWNDREVKSSLEIQIKDSIPLYSLMELENISGGDELFIQSIIQTFLESVPIQIDKINSAIMIADYQSIRNVAHQMKPSIDLFHIESAKWLIRNIEKEAEETFPDILRIEKAFEDIKITLELVVNQMSLH